MVLTQVRFRKAPVKLFYLINEPVLNYQAGYRGTIKNLISEGYLSDCFFYSFYVKLAELGNRQDVVIDDIIKELAEFRPDAILFAHTSNFNFNSDFFRRLETVLEYKPVYAMDERDVYGKYVKRLPSQLLELSAKCDVTFLVCSGGWMFRQFQKINNGKSVYLPHVCDDIHFGRRKPNGSPKKYDVVMIGNLAKSRVPFKSMPGVKERMKVAEALYKRHGKKFAVFGAGWENYPFCAGTVPFFKQEEVLRSSHMSVGVDHFLSYDQYFSDRLPIALFSGVPHLSWKTPGLELLFKEHEHIYYFNSISESVTRSESILSGSKNERDDITQKGESLIRSKYTEKARMKILLEEVSMIAKQK
jgi:hypothetical protein